MDDLEAWLRITLAKGVGPVSTVALLKQLKSATDIQSASLSDLRSAGLNKNQAIAIGNTDVSIQLQKTWDWLETADHHVIPITSADYPERLKELHDAPILLYVMGDKEILRTPQLAVVGSRKPTPSAARTAREFAHSLSQSGITITSGLALGIDAQAHKGCLDCDGLTIAVAATGLDRVYPAKHRKLAHRIVENGAIVSEFALGTATKAANFPKRNRIISGLSMGTLVVEAAIRSGSLTTARHATEQCREVLAIPGSIHNPLARGCHQLIRQGAKLVETADDILEELGSQVSEYIELSRTEEKVAPTENKETSDPQYVKLMTCLDFAPQSIDTLIECTGLPANEVASMLLILQLEGKIDALDANQYTLI